MSPWSSVAGAAGAAMAALAARDATVAACVAGRADLAAGTFLSWRELSGDTLSSPVTTVKVVHPYRRPAGIEGYVDSDVLQDQPSQGIEVEMVDSEIVRQIRAFAALGWGSRRIAGELGIARKTVQRYVRGGKSAETQVRPIARVLSDALRAEAVHLFETTAEGNAIVVADLFAERGVEVHPRTVQRVVRPHRQAKRAAEVATVRFETAPGHQLQIDFGEKWVWIGETRTRVMLFVAVLGYSRRTYVQAFLSQRHDDWREGLANAFRHFGG